jgi:hypothetical protein
MPDPAPPAQRYSPSAGIVVERAGNTMKISGKMELYGEKATAALATQLQNTINSMWTASFPDGTSSSCAVSVVYRAPGTPSLGVTTIEAGTGKGGAYVMPGPISNDMYLNMANPIAATWTVGHEFGHVLGMVDRYSEPVKSKILGRFGVQRTSTIEVGYETSLMGAHGAPLDQRTLKDAMDESKPWAISCSDDDAVRDWIDANGQSGLRKLSIEERIAMFEALMAGWVSGDDLRCMKAICASVTSRADAEKLRKAVNTLDFTSIAQRTEVRVALSKMP